MAYDNEDLKEAFEEMDGVKSVKYTADPNSWEMEVRFEGDQRGKDAARAAIGQVPNARYEEEEPTMWRVWSTR